MACLVPRPWLATALRCPSACCWRCLSWMASQQQHPFVLPRRRLASGRAALTAMRRPRRYHTTVACCHAGLQSLARQHHPCQASWHSEVMVGAGSESCPWQHQSPGQSAQGSYSWVATPASALTALPVADRAPAVMLRVSTCVPPQNAFHPERQVDEGGYECTRPVPIFLTGLTQV